MTLIAVGGSASVSKTTCAADLARSLGGAEVVHVDDLSRRLQSDGCPHFLDPVEAPWQQPAESLVVGLIEWTARLHPMIRDAAERLGASGGIMEGEGIDPRIARVGGWGDADVRTVYVIELDRQALWTTFAGRASGEPFLALSPREQATVVEMNRGYGEWLRGEAIAAGEPWVWSRPWATLAARMAQAVSAEGPGPGRR